MPPSAVTSKCRHGPSRDVPLRACRGLRGREEKANLGWRRALECLDLRRDVSLAEYDRRHRELHRAIEELEEIVPSCHSREAAATPRVSLRRGLAYAENSASLDVAPRYSRGRDETSRTGPNALLEPAQPDFPCSALNETKLEPTFGLHGKMDEFRRLKVTYPTASPRELADFQVLLRRWRRVDKMGVVAKTVVKIIVKTPATTAGGAGTALAWTSRTPASAARVADLLRDPGWTRRVIVPVLAQISLAETADVAVTGVEKRQTKIALQDPHFHPDYSRQNNLQLPLSQDHSISCFLQYIVRPQANPHRKTPPRSCLRFRPAPTREKASIVHATRPWTRKA